MILLNGLPSYLGVGFLHLTLINFFVIIIEFYLLISFSKQSKIRGWFIILANLVSAFLGIILASFITDNIGGNFWDGYIKETKPRQAFIMGLVAFIVFTIVVESPFYFWALKRQKQFGSTFKWSVFINLITNIPIVIFYYIQKLNYIDD